MRKTVLSTSLSPVLECQSDIITRTIVIESIIRQVVELGRTYDGHSGLQNWRRINAHRMQPDETKSPKDPNIQKEKATIV